PYDRMVRELLTTQVNFNRGMGRSLPAVGANTGLLAFFQANELKADNLAASTSRLFLGVKIECAQCHDHPFAKWTRKQFWEYAAFFGGIKSAGGNNGFFTPATEDRSARDIKMPGSEKKIRARFLDGREPDWKEDS